MTPLGSSDPTADAGADSVEIMLRATGLAKRFGVFPVVRGVDLYAARGELLALLGPSGCGKTTTLRLLAGFEQLDRGTIEIDGRVVANGLKSDPPERRHIGMVFQDGALFPHMSVGRNVGFGLRREDDRRALVADALRMVGLDGYDERMPSELSGGQQQRVALARAMAPNPALILLDEPFSNLDASLRAQVRSEVRDILDRAGATAILVTHDQEEAMSLADRVAVMWDGAMVQDASPEELYHRPASRAVGSFVGDAQFLSGESNGRRVTCAFGTLPAHNEAHGPVDVMLRPEAIRLSPVSEGGNGVVLNRLFFGHDQLMSVQLDAGLQVNARLGAYGGIRPGDRVQVSVRGAVLTFPRNET